MIKKLALLIFAIFVILFITLPLYALSTSKEVDFYGKKAPKGYVYIDKMEVVCKTVFWHNSLGYWESEINEGKKIPDMPEFWLNADLYYKNNPAMNIVAETMLPPLVKQSLIDGIDIFVAVIPHYPDAINASVKPTFSIDSDIIKIYALPNFKISTINSFTRGEFRLNYTAPVVQKGYGWNTYAMYYHNKYVGTLDSPHINDKNTNNRINVDDVVNASGQLKPGKFYKIYNPDTNSTDVYPSDELMIGNNDFDHGGGFGLVFEYVFDVYFYRNPIKLTDFELISIKNKSIVKTNELVKTNVKVRSNSDIDFIKDNLVVINLQAGNYSISKKIELKAYQEKDIQFEWKAPDKTGKIEVIATINPNRLIYETTYERNDGIVFVNVELAEDKNIVIEPEIILPVLPDISVVSHKPDKQLINSYVTSYIKLRNTYSERLDNIELLYKLDGKTYTKRVSIPENSDIEIPIEWLTPNTPEPFIMAQIIINPNKEIEESDYSNNEKYFPIMIAYPECDLIINSITPVQYNPGQTAITRVSVSNKGARDLSIDDMAIIKFSVEPINHVETRYVSIAAGSTIEIPFIWNTPTYNGNFNIIAEINYDQKIPETNYLNNKIILKDIEIKQEVTLPYNSEIVDSIEWIERRSNGFKIETVRLPDGNEYSYRIETFKDYKFNAYLLMSIKLTPGNVMKSGYGIECEVIIEIVSNYDKPELIINVQELYAYIPTNGSFSYLSPYKLERISTGKISKWHFPVNPASVANKRNIYVPIDWPDDKYFEIKFTGRNALCPNGKLSITQSKAVYIKGSMYDDDQTYTSTNR